MASLDASLPPPPSETGLGFLRRRLFSTWLDGAVTVAAGAFLVWIAISVADWAILNAIWGEAEPARWDFQDGRSAASCVFRWPCARCFRR